MLVLEKILSSLLTFPGLLWFVWLIVTIYLFKKGKSILIYIVSLVTLIVMFVLFTAFGTSLLVVPLENMYLSETARSIDEYDQKYPIVVMGGGIYYRKDEAYLSPYSLQRLFKGYELYREIKSPILFTGGVAIGKKEISESEIAAAWLTDMGVRKKDIIIEDKARTTYENAVYVGRWLSEYNFNRGLVLEKGGSVDTDPTDSSIYLVTNAIHMTRSVLVFEKQGINAIPINAGIVTNHSPSWLDYLPNSSSLSANMMALHEWQGLLWYKITNRI